MAFRNYNVIYVSSVKYNLLTAWSAGAAHSIGDICRRVTFNSSNASVFWCYQAGTSGGTEPAWSTLRGQTTTDNTVKWIEIGGQPGVNGDLTNTGLWATVRNTTLDTGNIIKDASNNLFIVTVNGTTNNTAEPTWNTTLGGTTTDGTVTWMCMGPGSGFAAWKAPQGCIRMGTRGSWGAYDSTHILQQVYVAHDHSFNDSGGVTISSPNTDNDYPVDIICVNSAGSVPPVTADLRTTALEQSSGGSGITVDGAFRMIYGITFDVTGAANYSMTFGASHKDALYSNCVFKLSATGSGAAFQANSGNNARFEDCTFTFANTGQCIQGSGNLNFVRCSFALTGSVPTTFIQGAGGGQSYRFEGCDLSAITGILLGGNFEAYTSYEFVDCKMASSYTMRSLGGSDFANSNNCPVSIIRSSSGTDTDQFAYANHTGTITCDHSVVRTGGASGASALSYKMASSTYCNSGGGQMSSPPIVQPNSTTAANVNVTVYGIANLAAPPTTLDAWLEVQYLGSSGNTQMSKVSSRQSDFLATTSLTNCTTDSSAWDSAATARANTHAYALGDVIKTASNAGRVFFCTTAGTSAGSEPGGFASAIDGGSVTDGTAVFRAGTRFKIQVTLTSPQPQLAGDITAFFKVGKPSTTFYFDPLLTVA